MTDMVILLSDGQMLSLMGKQKVSANCQIRSHRLETEKYAPCALCCLRCCQGKTWQNISKIRLNLQFRERIFLIQEMGVG